MRRRGTLTRRMAVSVAGAWPPAVQPARLRSHYKIGPGRPVVFHGAPELIRRVSLEHRGRHRFGEETGHRPSIVCRPRRSPTGMTSGACATPAAPGARSTADRDGSHRYWVKGKNGTQVDLRVVPGHQALYLRTDPDGVPENNLDELPEC